MVELTYILGAGASYQSFPVVKTFTNRYEKFLRYLRSVFDDNRFDMAKRERFRQLYEVALYLLSAFESHQSFDTYFKKLFHTAKNESIIEAKKVLNIYFLWEHLSKIEPKPKNSSNEGSNSFWKQSKIDTRYDALIAGLLKPEFASTEPYCNINFITWNYDLNLLCCLKNYYAPDTKFEDFISNIQKRENLWVIQNKISIINLNGYFYSNSLNKYSDIDEITEDFIHEIIDNKISNGFLEKGKKDIDAELIKFAWEGSQNIVDLAKQKIETSDTIIVIGYTFPLYNRRIDLRYFDNQEILSEKHIIIQDPNAAKIKSTLLESWGYNDNLGFADNITIKEDCDYFYVPSSIPFEEY